MTPGVTRWQLKLAIAGADDLVVGRMKTTRESSTATRYNTNDAYHESRAQRVTAKHGFIKGTLPASQGSALGFFFKDRTDM